MTLKAPFDMECILPHRPPMRLVDDIEQYSSKTLLARLEVRPDNIFLFGTGIFHRCGLLECMAQAVASLFGIRNCESEGEAKIGYLVGTGPVTYADIDVPVGAVLLIHVEEIGSTGGFGSYDCRITWDSRMVCEGIVKVLVE